MNTQEIISNEQISSLERLAAIIAKSGMGGFKTPEQATVALLLALAEGIPLGRVIHEYHVINGRLSLRSECMLARFQKAGGSVEYHIHNDTEVSLTASHPKGNALTVVWTIERARKAGLTSNPNWAKHPAAMLTARATVEAVRAVYPACLSGIPAEEEAVEITTLPARNGNGSHSLPAPVDSEPIADFVARHGNGAHLLPGELTPTPRAYTIIDGRQRYAAVARRRKNERSPALTVPQQETAPEAPEPAPEAVAPEAVAHQPEALEPEAVATAPELPERGTGGIRAFWHPLDEALGALDQEKLSEFLFKLDFIQLGQNYKYCGPKATRRILAQLPSFLKAGGFDDAGFDQ